MRVGLILQDMYHISFIFNADAKFGNESVVEKVLRQDCSEVDLRINQSPDVFPSDLMTHYERKDEVTFIAYCDHENCNTKQFMETSLKAFSQDKWFLVGSSHSSMCLHFLHKIPIYLLKYGQKENKF